MRPEAIPFNVPQATGAELTYVSTNRAQFARGEVDRYTWVGEGSNYLLGELNAAYLWAQLEQAAAITAERRAIWQRYYEAFGDVEARGVARRPVVPTGCEHNGHIFHLLLDSRAHRDALIATLAECGIQSVFHYVPLHSSPAGRHLGRTARQLPVTDDASERLARLPLCAGMGFARVQRVIDAVRGALSRTAVAA